MEYSNDDLRELASRWVERSRLPKRFRVYTDTSDFYRIDYDDVVILGGCPYLIRNNEREGRFGIDEQQKFWVKRSVDLRDGSRKIIKLVFHERFKARVGPLVFDCARSPAKESRVLSLTRSEPNFMHGNGIPDAAGNEVRVIDFVHGRKLSDYVEDLRKDHAAYFSEDFPGLLVKFIETVDAIRLIHDRDELHGDIRRDHIIIDSASGRFRWIDFDFIYFHHENRFGYDIFGLGNILAFLVGKGDITIQMLRRFHPGIFSTIVAEDMNIIFNNRVMNMQKIFPYVPHALNQVLMHFAHGSEVFYDETEDLLADLRHAAESIAPERMSS